MSSPQYAITPTGFKRGYITTFTAANGTVAKVMVDAIPANLAANPAIYGGCTLIDGVVTSTDLVKDIQTYTGTIVTTVDAGSVTGAVTSTSTTNATLVRTNGSWITDGVRVGDNHMLFAPIAPGSATTPQTVEGVISTVTTVTALTITYNGVPSGWTAITVTTGTRIVKVSPHFRQTVTAGAGTSTPSAAPSVPLLNFSNDGSTIKTELKFGPNDMYIVAMQSAVGALPAYVSIDPVLAIY